MKTKRPQTSRPTPSGGQCTPAPVCQAPQQSSYGNQFLLEMCEAQSTQSTQESSSSSSAGQASPTRSRDGDALDPIRLAANIAGLPDLVQSGRDINATLDPSIRSTQTRWNRWKDVGVGAGDPPMAGKIAPKSAKPKGPSRVGKVAGGVDFAMNGYDLYNNFSDTLDTSRHFDDRLDSGVASTGNVLSMIPTPITQGTGFMMGVQQRGDQIRREHGMLPASDEVANNMRSTYDTVNGVLGDNMVSNILGHTAAFGVGTADSLWEGTKNYAFGAYGMGEDAVGMVKSGHSSAVDAVTPEMDHGRKARTIQEQQRRDEILRSNGNRGKVTFKDQETSWADTMQKMAPTPDTGRPANSDWERAEEARLRQDPRYQNGTITWK